MQLDFHSRNSLRKIWQNTRFRGGSKAGATSRMKRFVIIVNGFHPLTIITKRSILDVAVALDPPLRSSLRKPALSHILPSDHQTLTAGIKKMKQFESSLVDE